MASNGSRWEKTTIMNRLMTTNTATVRLTTFLLNRCAKGRESGRQYEPNDGYDCGYDVVGGNRTDTPGLQEVQVT